MRPCDFDGDGDPDLFIAGRHTTCAYPVPASSALLKNDQGKFTDVTADMAPGVKDLSVINDAVWTDLDGNQKPDLVLAGEWTPILVFLNKGDQLVRNTDDFTLQSSTGWWFSIKAADMDRDGDQDLIAGNLGLNYKYKASEEEPFEVYYYDFDDNGSKDVVLTYYNFGVQFPLRGRQCSSEQVPALSQKFPTYDMFASSNVAQVYGKDKLKNALHLEAKTFASTYFENLGNGLFRPHILPTMAQLSSVNDIITEDFNKDGHMDLLLAGNLYQAEIETTRNDAGYGMILLGDGKSGFTALDRIKSGIFMPWDVKSLASMDSPSGRVILAGCNDDILRVFRQNPAEKKGK